MSCIPLHGRVDCTACYRGASVVFNKTVSTEGDWRITANPLAWGNPRAEILVLGFSKGPNAIKALVTQPHDAIPYAGQRHNVLKILSRVGVMKRDADVNRLIADRSGRFAWGSLICCTVERREEGEWKGSGGGMLDRFVATPFGRGVASNCASRFLAELPPETKLVILFGLGTKQNYVPEARKLIELARSKARWREVNEVAYTDESVTFVHVEHFAAQGPLIPGWCGDPNPKKDGAISPRARLGQLAYAAIETAGIDNFPVA